MTAVVLALFNLGPHRLKMVDGVIRYLKRQNKVPHLILGILGEGSPTESVDQLIRLRGNPELFQKEAIWNSLAKKIPAEIKNLVFLDADIFPLDRDWIEKIEASLEKHPMLQAYSTLYYLTKANTLKLLESEASFAHKDVVDDETLILNRRSEHTENQAVAYPSFAFTQKMKSKQQGASGGCLAFRKEYFEAIGGFPFEEVFGGVNDILLFHKLSLPTKWDPLLFAASLRKKYFQGLQPAPSLSFVPRRLYHLYHKSGADRNYTRRVALAKDLGYDPEKDLEINETGGLDLSESGKRLLPTLKRITEEFLRPDL